MNNESNVIFQGRDHERVSSMVKAMQSWQESLVTPDELPKGQFGRVVKIQTNGLTVTNALDLEFEAEIKIYNLTKQTIERFKIDEEISIIAGYGDDTGVVFTGVISSVKTKRSGQDKVTTIMAIDDVTRKEKNIESISFKAGVKASYVLKTLVGKLNLPIAVFNVRRDHIYAEAVTVSGGLMNNIKQYAEVCGVSAYVCKRKVYVRHLSEGDELNFTVKTDTGLIGSPEEFTEEILNEDYEDKVNGVKFKMLLEHRITTASIITLNSREINGKFRVREGSHICNEVEFYTEVMCIE